MGLKSLIQEEILDEGPLSLSRYMALCLYHPDYGYYMTRNPLGKEGDFITSPEISSLFGEIIAVSLETLMGERGYINPAFMELGGGRGLLMHDMARTFQVLGRNMGSYHMVEVSPVLRALQQKTLENFEVTWSKSLPPTAAPCLMVANEFFDAFPIDQYIFRESGWQERCVTMTADGDFFWTTRPTAFVPPSSWRLPSVGDIFEDPVGAVPYFESILAYLKSHGGIFLTIDYGHTHLAYGDTVQAVADHQYVDPLSYLGECDLTTHVNFKILADLAHLEGLTVLPILTQGDFLAHYGIHERVKTCPVHIQEAVKKLTDFHAMGSLFKVMIVIQ